MNPYWINPAPDTEEWIHSDQVKRQFFLLVACHVVLWVASLSGIIFLFAYAQKPTPIRTYTKGGTPTWGRPIASGTEDTAAKEAEFLTSHFQSIITYLFMRTEKGHIPLLKAYTDPRLLKIFDDNFNFVKNKKGGWSQTMVIDEFKGLVARPNRIAYRVKGTIYANSLDGYSATPVYMLALFDKRAGNDDNPTGWVVDVIVSVSPQDYYEAERNNLVEEVTKSSGEILKKDEKKSVKESQPSPQNNSNK